MVLFQHGNAWCANSRIVVEFCIDFHVCQHNVLSGLLYLNGFMQFKNDCLHNSIMYVGLYIQIILKSCKLIGRLLVTGSIDSSHCPMPNVDDLSLRYI